MPDIKNNTNAPPVNLLGKFVTIVCFPRSGSTYFGQYLEQRTLCMTNKSHSPRIVPGKTMIGVFRDPLESITSFVVKEIAVETPKDISVKIKYEIEQYNKMLEFLISKIDILISFENIVNDIELCMLSLSKILNVRLYTQKAFMDRISEIERDTFVKTSKDLPGYEEVLTMISKIDMSNSYRLFDQAKQKALVPGA